MLTYQEQLDLVKRGYAKVSTNGNLSTFKYARRVFYNNLWNSIPGITECRGHTYDNTNGELVLAAPTKTFNYGENGHWSNVPLDTNVVLYTKYNGFMATVSKYNEEIVIGTTGSTKSDFAKLARAVLVDIYTETGLNRTFDSEYRYTRLFEICHSSDPHIVDEDCGAHLLGTRDHTSGRFDPCGRAIMMSLDEALLLAKQERNVEGWMVYHPDHGVCKLKTNYYIDKKRLMRMSTQQVKIMYNNPMRVIESLSTHWKFAVEPIIVYHTESVWSESTDQERRKFLEKIE